MGENQKIYYGYFKCRMCGKEFYNFSNPTQEEAVDIAKSRLNTYHYHDDGSIGYSDFIGFKYEEVR